MVRFRTLAASVAACFTAVATLVGGSALTGSIVEAAPPSCARVGSVNYPFVSRDVAKGYALCSLEPSPGTSTGYVMIIDLKAGARLANLQQVTSGSGTANAQFQRRIASDWWNWAGSNVASPSGGPLQAVVNAAFLTSYNPTTALSFPLKNNGTVLTPGANPDGYSKRMFGWYANGSKAYLSNFNYTGNDPSTVNLYMSSVNAGVVGYYPNGGPAQSPDRRNFVGVRDTDGNGDFDRVYILATKTSYSLAEATRILAGHFGTSSNVQLDGGGSTQLYTGLPFDNKIDSKGCGIPTVGCRAVPHMIAVYSAP